MISKKEKTYKCAVCKEPFVKRSAWQKVCQSSTDCAISYTKTKKEKLEHKETKARKEALKTRSDYMKDAQKAFNAYIRARDADKPCISCGVPLKQEALGGGYDCGHYRSAGSAPHLRFHPDNAHGQCKKCNRYLSGNAVEYRKNLVSRIGLNLLELLERDQCVRKYTIEGLQMLTSDYKKLTKELK
jgi:Bacteriophage Lambda NinG protein